MPTVTSRRRLKPQKDTEYQVMPLGKAAFRRASGSRKWWLTDLPSDDLVMWVEDNHPEYRGSAALEVKWGPDWVSVNGEKLPSRIPLDKQIIQEIVKALDSAPEEGATASRSAGLGGLFVHFMNSVLKKPQGKMQNKVNRLRQKHGNNWDEIGKDVLIELGGELNRLAQQNNSTSAAINMAASTYSMDPKMIKGLFYDVGAPFQDSGAQFDMMKIKESKATVLRAQLNKLEDSGVAWDEAKQELLSAAAGLKINPKDRRTIQDALQSAQNYEKAESSLIQMAMKHQGLGAELPMMGQVASRLLAKQKGKVVSYGDAAYPDELIRVASSHLAAKSQVRSRPTSSRRRASDIGEAVESLAGDVQDPNWIQLSEVFDRLHSRHPNDPKIEALGNALTHAGVSGKMQGLAPYVQQYLKAQPRQKAASQVPMVVVAYTIPWAQKKAIKKAQLAFRRSAGIRLATNQKGLLVVADHNALAATGMTLPSLPKHVRFARSAGQVLSSTFHQHLSGIVTADVHVALSAPAARRYAGRLIREGGVYAALVWDISGTPHMVTAAPARPNMV